MSHTRLSAMAGPTIFKQRAVQEASLQQKVVDDKIKKLGLSETGYEFKELIGKGAYGRVYKSIRKASGLMVAVKVLETDRMDFDTKGPNKDVGMQDALKEIDILRRLKQSKAVNVNMFVEAFQVHSQLWIVSEYCSGGSLTTLRRATANKLFERHIVTIARELALGLRSVHAAGIVHRDIKCSNVMINEQGKLQIIDFGVSGILLSNLEEDKRKTVIGTPHWMPPELQHNTAEVKHGTEVDVWAYGITLYECATGGPPHARTINQRELRSKIKQLPAPRLPEDRFSKELADLVAYSLEQDPAKRPSMGDICKQELIAGSEENYPTESLRELVEKYYIWEVGGGQRASLWMQGGAAEPRPLSMRIDDEDEDWNFSTTAKFEQVQQPVIERMSMNPEFKFGMETSEFLSNSPPEDFDEYEPYDQPTARLDDTDTSERPTSSTGKRSLHINHEERVARGAHALQGLFDENASPYKFKHGPPNDLPLRSGQSGSYHQKELSVSSQGGTPNITLDNIPKKKRDTMGWKWDENLGGQGGMSEMDKKKRATMEWKWNDGFGETPVPPVPARFSTQQTDQNGPPVRPMLKHSATAPLSATERPESMTLDLDMLMDDSQSQTMKPQTYDQSWSDNGGNSYATTMHYDDENADIGMTMRASHIPTHSGGSSHLAPSDMASTAMTSYQSYTPSHSRTASYQFPPPLSPEILRDGAPLESLMAAFDNQISSWMKTLDAIEQKLGADSDSDDEDGGESTYPNSSRHGSGNWDFGQDSEADGTATTAESSATAESSTTDDDGTLDLDTYGLDDE